MTMRWVQIISRKGQWETRTRKVRGRARLQSCRNGGKILRALSPEIALPILLESSETICQIPNQIGKDRVRTAWRHAESGRNVHSSSHEKLPSAAKAEGEADRAARLKPRPFKSKSKSKSKSK